MEYREEESEKIMSNKKTIEIQSFLKWVKENRSKNVYKFVFSLIKEFDNHLDKNLNSFIKGINRN